MAEIRAVAPLYRYSMKPPTEGWNQTYWNVIYTVFEIEKTEVDRELIQQLHRRQLSTAEYQLEYLHLIWLRVATLLGLEYTRYEG